MVLKNPILIDQHVIGLCKLESLFCVDFPFYADGFGKG